MSYKFDIKYGNPLPHINLIVVENPKIDLISTHILFKVGSQNEIWGKTGIAHLFEHLMFEGTHNLPKGQHDKIVTKAGGNCNAFTNYDYTSYIMTLPANQLEMAIWLEADRYYNLMLNQENLENQQSVVTEEIKQTMFNRPYGTWRKELAETAFYSHSTYSWEIAGSIEDVNRFELYDLQSFYQTHYSDNKRFISVSGNVKYDEIAALVSKYYSENKNITTNIELEIPIQKIDSVSKTIIANNPLDAAFINFHFDGFLNEKDALCADILAFIAGAGDASLMHEILEYDKQVASHSGCFADKREKTSLLTFYAIANTPEISCNLLLDETQLVIEKLKDSNYIKNNFGKAITNFKTNFAEELQYNRTLSHIAAHSVAFFNDPYKLNRLFDLYDSINAKDVVEFANRILESKKSVNILFTKA